MNNKKLFSFFILVTFFSIPNIGNAQDHDNLYDSYITLLSPYIVEELLKQNIEDNSFSIEDSEIVSIERPDASNVFYPTLKIHTYAGPHNPPYGTVIIKFKVTPSGIDIVNFEHKKIKANNDACDIGYPCAFLGIPQKVARVKL